MDNLDILKKYLLGLAETLLSDSGEFYPFAAYINDSDVLVPLIVSQDSDTPDALEMKDEIYQVLLDKFRNNTTQLAGLATDVNVISATTNEKIDALEILLMFPDEEIGFYFPYQIKIEGVLFQDAFII